MSYITSSLTIIITFISFESAAAYSQDYNYSPFTKRYTQKIKLKQGYIQGVVITPKMNSDLPKIEHYRGVPYAAPPVGDLRFMPPRDAPSWEDVKYADNFGPVCPQKFPDIKNMPPKRKQEFLLLREYLLNESEDCLYLNIYTPHDPDGMRMEKYPVIVFIHGESFEWNSGNPYDGSVLSAYGRVVFITFNYRLGILGFLKTGTGDDSKSNFGLVDQIAALVWIRENVAAFGGDPDSVTLMGHGTGAVCASLLTLSPMVLPEHQLLFHRAILMGGTALADWALSSNPQDVTFQVARALNCPVDDDFEACLRSKRLDEIMETSIFSRPYATRFGPIVDSRIVPNDPLKSMTNFTSIFRSFDMMYGVTEVESINFLGPIALTYGMLQKERDQELRNYLRFTCETKPELCVSTILEEYTGNIFIMDDEAYSSTVTNTAGVVRDSLLDILSDARTVAPILKMGLFHSMVNRHSYFYVFTHKTESKDHLRNKTSTGDELPYVFGVPLGGSSFHFVDRYTEREALFSEVIMTYICNFAYRGNPNRARKLENYSLGQFDWTQYDVDWPEFGSKQQYYLQLDTPLQTLSHYRSNKIEFWNEAFPKFLQEAKKENERFSLDPPVTAPSIKRPKGTPPYIFTQHFGQKYETAETRPSSRDEDKPEVFGTVVNVGTERPDNMVSHAVYGTIVNSPSDLERATTMNVIVISGCIFLFANFLLFMVLYYKCYRLKKNRDPEIMNNEVEDDNDGHEKKNRFEENQAFVPNGCGLMKMISKSNKSDDVYEAVKIGSQNSQKYKLGRQLSNSTIDAHTKVRDWIAHEITNKYSPKFTRKSRQTAIDLKKSTSQNKSDEIISLNNETDSILGRSPTRPVSPVTPFMESSAKPKPILVKQTSLPLQNIKKPGKVSVAIDATPSGRGPSVLAQQPIELTKSLDLGGKIGDHTLRRSITLDDFSPRVLDDVMNFTKSVNNLTSKSIPKPTLVKIEHSHSKSDPIQDTYIASNMKKLRTFDPTCDVNVTSFDEKTPARPLSPEESLMTIKRRNYPKVLPDYPTKEALAQKRRSMPAANLNIPFNDLRNKLKIPPAPPVRTTSTLGRKPQTNPPIDHLVCTSAPVLAEESSSSPEPELTYNNLYVGPLIPKKSNADLLDINPIYSSLNAVKNPCEKLDNDRVPPVVAIVTTHPTHPLKKPEPKTVIRPKMVRQISDPKSRVIPRVTATDNLPSHHPVLRKTDKDEQKTFKTEIESGTDSKSKLLGPSIIPTLPKHNNSNKDSSSSETPSEDSDTGTVVKRTMENER